MEMSKQRSYQQAFELASASLKERDLKERADKAGSIYRKDRGDEKVVIPFFSVPYTIHFPRVEFSCPGGKTVSLVVRDLLLHYLLRADGTSISGDWAAYKDIPGGLHYASVFARRVTEPLVHEFGSSAASFCQAGIRLGAIPVKAGDASFYLQALPRIPLQYVLWEGDEEFPASANLLFDSSVDHYLSLEDMVVLGQITTGRLISLSRRPL